MIELQCFFSFIHCPWIMEIQFTNSSFFLRMESLVKKCFFIYINFENKNRHIFLRLFFALLGPVLHPAPFIWPIRFYPESLARTNYIQLFVFITNKLIKCLLFCFCLGNSVRARITGLVRVKTSRSKPDKRDWRTGLETVLYFFISEL